MSNDIIFCPGCGVKITTNTNFCYKCGTNVSNYVNQIKDNETIKCPNCGALNPLDTNVCLKCWEKIDSELDTKEDIRNDVKETRKITYSISYEESNVNSHDKIEMKLNQRELIKKGDFVEIRYVGKIKETGKIFDVTDETKAKQANVYAEGNIYEPIQIIVGAGHVIKGLDDALLDIGIGETKTFDIPPDKGFGKRSSELVQTMHLNEFKKQGISPKAGLKIEINGHWAIVRSVSSGRVKLDFNHPLSGKTLLYEITVLKKIEDLTEKINAILKVRAPGIDVSSQNINFEKEKVNIELRDINPQYRESLEKFIKADISTYIPEIRYISTIFID